MSVPFPSILHLFPDRPPLRLVVVEGDATVLDALTEACPLFGVELVGSAATTAEGLALAHVHAPDLAIVGLRLADDQTGGLKVARRCRQYGAEVILLTGWATTPETLRAAVRLRPAMILNKPLSTHTLYLAVLSVVGRRL